jgi:hypothetical protein
MCDAGSSVDVAELIEQPRILHNPSIYTIPRLQGGAFAISGLEVIRDAEDDVDMFTRTRSTLIQIGRK